MSSRPYQQLLSPPTIRYTPIFLRRQLNMVRIQRSFTLRIRRDHFSGRYNGFLGSMRGEWGDIERRAVDESVSNDPLLERGNYRNAAESGTVPAYARVEGNRGGLE